MSGMEALAIEGGSVQAYVADSAGEPAPGVAVYHPWWGLNDDVKSFADRLARAGFYVIAPDMFDGQIATTVEEAEKLARGADDDRCSAIAAGAVDLLMSRAGAGQKV